MVRCVSWVVAGIAITAYSFNSQVFVWIGRADYGGKLFELFIFHSGFAIVLPYFLVRGVTTVLTDSGMSMRKVGGGVLLAAMFQMVIYYCWFLASLRIPTQVLAAIFQSSIAVVYILSIIFLDEQQTLAKMVGILAAILGVCIASFVDENASEVEKTEHYWGVFFALLADLSKAVYQIWFKVSFGQPSPSFMLLFGSLISIAHVFPILPIIATLDYFGVPDARISFQVDSTGIWLTALAAMIAVSVNFGFLVTIALESPLFLASAQLLAIPLSVFFDATVRHPQALPDARRIPGYVLIFVAFFLLTRKTTSSDKTTTSDDSENGSASETVELKQDVQIDAQVFGAKCVNEA